MSNRTTTTPGPVVYAVTVARERGATLVHYAVARERFAAILSGSAGPVLSVARLS